MQTDYCQRVLDVLTISVIVLDERLRLIFMNPAAEMLFALSFRQARGMQLQDLATGAHVLVGGMRHCLSKGHPYTERQLHLTLPNDQAITVDCTVSPLLGPEDKPVELLVELRQVDRQLRINREAHLITQNNTSRTLARNLAHEIKNPLGGLRGAAQLLESEFTDSSLKEYTQIIIGEADRLRNLVDRMLGPNQLPVNDEVNIHEVLERVRNLVMAEFGSSVAIEQDYDPSIPPLRGDADQLVQAVLNIVRNALEALENQMTNTSGVITLRSRVQRQCTIGPKRYKLVARVDIIDNGPGIPEEKLEEIFYPLITGRAKGTGLGLSIAQILVNQHNGLVECESRPGNTVFTILLPLEKNDGK